MNWIYYIYTYREIYDSNDNNFDNSNKGNFRIGRACIADIQFKSAAEIPLSCGDSDKVHLAKFDKKNNLLYAVMENGKICKWGLHQFNKKFHDLAFSCWYWKGK